MKDKKDVTVPGAALRPGITELNNSADDPNKVARDRERLVQAMAVAATGGEGDYAPLPDLDPGPALEDRVINGVRVRVRIPSKPRDGLAAKFGPESRHPKGTQVRQDGKACEGDEEAYGVIGDYETTEGILVNRIIPIETEKGA